MVKLNYSEEFLEYYWEGFSFYVSGEWQDAREALEDALWIQPKDSLSLKLIEIMEHHDFQPPFGWDGFWDFEAGH